MSEELNPPPVALAVRFRLRTALAATTVLAMFAAVTSALVRRTPVESRSGFLAQWGICLAGVVVAIIWRWQTRRREIHDAGQISFELRQAKSWRNAWRKLPLFWTLFLIIPLNQLAGTIATANAGMTKPWRLAALESLVMLPFISIGASQLIGFVLSLRPVRITENGLLAGDEFICWHRISVVRWHARHSDQLEFSTWSTRMRYALLVPPLLQEKVESIVRVKTCFADAAVV